MQFAMFKLMGLYLWWRLHKVHEDSEKWSKWGKQINKQMNNTANSNKPLAHTETVN